MDALFFPTKKTKHNREKINRENLDREKFDREEKDVHFFPIPKEQENEPKTTMVKK